jgi:hypothetical protein
VSLVSEFLRAAMILHKRFGESPALEADSKRLGLERALPETWRGHPNPFERFLIKIPALGTGAAAFRKGDLQAKVGQNLRSLTCSDRRLLV